MTLDREVLTHYSRGNLLSRLNAALSEDGIDTEHPSVEALAPYDQFHGRGLDTPEDARSGLIGAGFEVVRLHSTLEKARAFGARSRAMVERGEKPPYRAVMLIHGDAAKQAMANVARGFIEARINPIEVLARKR